MRHRFWQLEFLRFCLAGLACLALNVSAQAQGTGAAIETSADYAILLDVGTNTILFEKNADKLMAPASMAKLMTQEFVFHEISEGRITLETEFPISENAWRKGGAASGGSTMFAELNSKIQVRDLLRGAIIVSANDACIALAEGVAGSEETFAQELTQRAKQLGMTRSTFSNATGLPDKSLRTTVRDLSTLALHIIRTYPDYYKWYSDREFVWTIKTPQYNRNPLLQDVQGADGMKTGYTEESGYGLVGSAIRDGRRLLVVVNGHKSANERAVEAKKLLEWGYRNFDSRRLFAANTPLGEARLFHGAASTVSLVARDDVVMLAPRSAQPRDIKAKIVYKSPVRAPVEEGAELGKIQIYNGSVLALERPVYAGASVEEGSLTQKAIDGAKELVRTQFKNLMKK